MRSKHPWRDEVFRQLFATRRPVRKAVKAVYKITIFTVEGVGSDLFGGLFGSRRRRRRR